MDRRTRKILSGLHDDIIEILMKCEDIGEAKARLEQKLQNQNNKGSRRYDKQSSFSW